VQSWRVLLVLLMQGWLAQRSAPALRRLCSKPSGSRGRFSRMFCKQKLVRQCQQIWLINKVPTMHISS
jgi:hypothetical protein